MLPRTTALVLLAVLPIAGCAKHAAEPPAVEMAAAPPQQAAGSDAAPAGAPAELRALGYASASGAEAAAPGSPPRLADAGRKLVKTVDLELRVTDTSGTADRLRGLATGLGGYVSAMSAERRGELLYYTLTLRVPVDRLEEALRRAKGLAERVEREAIRTEDVTERWVDLEARLTTLRATENELRQLLTEARQRRQDVEDIMKVYGKLTEIRTAIEQLQGEQQALQSLTSLSTVNVQLVPTEASKPIVAEGWSPRGTLRGSFRTLVQALQSLTDLAIVLLVVAVPLGLIVLLPIWLLARIWRRARQRRQASSGG